MFGAGAILLLFYLPYISLLKFYGFSRGLADGADLSNYFSVSKRNIILGKLLSPLGTPEVFFFLVFWHSFCRDFSYTEREHILFTCRR